MTQSLPANSENISGLYLLNNLPSVVKKEVIKHVRDAFENNSLLLLVEDNLQIQILEDEKSYSCDFQYPEDMKTIVANYLLGKKEEVFSTYKDSFLKPFHDSIILKFNELERAFNHIEGGRENLSQTNGFSFDEGSGEKLRNDLLKFDVDAYKIIYKKSKHNTKTYDKKLKQLQQLMEEYKAFDEAFEEINITQTNQLSSEIQSKSYESFINKISDIDSNSLAYLETLVVEVREASTVNKEAVSVKEEKNEEYNKPTISLKGVPFPEEVYYKMIDFIDNNGFLEDYKMFLKKKYSFEEDKALSNKKIKKSIEVFLNTQETEIIEKFKNTFLLSKKKRLKNSVLTGDGTLVIFTT